jgi:cholesterol oxidase
VAEGTVETVDAVVVGSGFGGSVAAWLFAEAGHRVVVLERGRFYPPHSFPRSARGMGRNLWDPSEGLYGLFDIWSFRSIDAVVASGVGGGSLIYANVLLRKDERWFEEDGPGGERWPIKYADIEPHYDRVEPMFGLQTYPIAHPPYDRTAKTLAFRDAAARCGLDWSLPPLAVTFANRGDDPKLGEPIVEDAPNLHGQSRHTCRLCGECVVGCNYGSKNTLDYTFLSAATRCRDGEGEALCELRALSEVRSIAADPESGYTVSYVRHDLAREGEPFDTRSLPIQTIRAPVVVLAAGALGSTYLLLRSLTGLPELPRERLGEGFSGNGDLLGFAVGCRDEKGRTAIVDPTAGPSITSAVRVPDARDGAGRQGRGFYIQEGGFPPFASWIAETARTPAVLRRKLRFAWRYIAGLVRLNRDSNLSAEFSDFVGNAELTASTLVMLGMGRDVPGGRASLSGRHLDLDWPREASKEFFGDLRRTMRAIAEAKGGRLVTDPLGFLNRGITVHPLGGCRMAESRQTGVVDTFGEVFGHPGLIVADGSVMPGPVGPNPGLTIAALADRFAGRAIERYLDGKPRAPSTAELSRDVLQRGDHARRPGLPEMDADRVN